MQRFLTVSEVAEILDVSTRHVYALVRSGELRGVQVGGRNQWRVPSGELCDYLARRNDDGDEPPLMGALV